MNKTKAKLFMMVGCPGSGKSSFLGMNPLANSIVVSRDEVRFSLLKDGEDYFAHEKEVYKIFIQKIKDGLDRGYTVFADATHLNAASRRKLLRSVEWGGPTAAVYFDVSLETCLERNALRDKLRFVPETQLKNMYHSLTKPDMFEEEIDEVYVIDEIGHVKEHIIK